MSRCSFKITVEWDWATWGVGVGISRNPIRDYIFGLEIGPFGLLVQRDG